MATLTENLLEVYKVLGDRIVAHYELRHKHTTSMLTFQTALLTLFGLLLTQESCPDWKFGLVSWAMPILGIFLAMLWIVLSINDKMVQLALNQILENIE